MSAVDEVTSAMEHVVHEISTKGNLQSKVDN